ncbi:hypothetical protein ACTSKR_15400 [Chitinibacteraceae bacterium HSL-7]
MMRIYDLPAIQGTAQAPFEDVRSARAWLKLLPLINAPVAHAELVEAVTALNESAISPLESLKILEQFREGAHLVQDTLSARFLARALPFGHDESEAWRNVTTLWSVLRDGYARIWRAALEGQIEVTEHTALLAQRTLRYQGLLIREALLSYRAAGDDAWQRMFGYYQLADEALVAQKPAKDSLLSGVGIATPENTFVQTLLLAAASPYHLSSRQMLWLSDILPAFAQRSPLELEARALPGRGSLQVDLDAPSAPHRTEPRLSGPSIREIDTFQLAQTLTRRIKLLRNGEAPDKLGLGQQFPATMVEAMLTELYRTWCEQPTERTPRKPENRREIRVLLGHLQQHQAIAHGHFSLPEEAPGEMVGQDLVRMQLFGRTQAMAAVQVASEPPPAEVWHVANESAHGMQLVRASASGARINLQQLIAVQMGERYFCGVVRWLQQGDDELTVGVRFLPGQPSAAAIRPVDLMHAGKRSWTEAIALPPSPLLKAPASLVLPVGWFRANRIIECWDGQATRKLRLMSVLERGVDFERIHYALAGER